MDTGNVCPHGLVDGQQAATKTTSLDIRSTLLDGDNYLDLLARKIPSGVEGPICGGRKTPRIELDVLAERDRQTVSMQE